MKKHCTDLSDSAVTLTSHQSLVNWYDWVKPKRGYHKLSLEDPIKTVQESYILVFAQTGNELIIPLNTCKETKNIFNATVPMQTSNEINLRKHVSFQPAMTLMG